MKPVYCIAACTLNGGIGLQGNIPWNFKKDLQHFVNLSRSINNDNNNTHEHNEKKKVNAVIMGRLTWDSLPSKKKPLKGRLNVVVSSSHQTAPQLLQQGTIQHDIKSVITASSFEHALKLVDSYDSVHSIFVIGGERLYKEALIHHRCVGVYLTLIVRYDYTCDRYFPINSLLQHYVLDYCYSVNDDDNNNPDKNNTTLTLSFFSKRFNSFSQ